jgi:hypothetical protein
VRAAPIVVRAAVVVAVLAALGGGAAAPVGTASGPGSAAMPPAIGGSASVDPPAAAYPVAVTLTGVTPDLPGPNDTLTLTGQLANTTTRQITGAQLGVAVGGGAPIAGQTQNVAPLSPGQSVPFTLQVPVSALGLGGADDYVLTVAVTAGVSGVLGAARTDLPWLPPGTAGQPLKAAVVWPLTDTPRMEALSLGEPPSAQPVFRDDDLATEFGGQGRLGQLVAAAAGLPVTWTVDPGLLDEAVGMSGGYRVANTPYSGNPQESKAGTGQAAATAWLAALKAVVKGHTVQALPYADPDLASLAHRGTGSAATRSVVTQAVPLAGTATTGALGAAPSGQVAWAYDGALDTSVTGLAGQLGLTTFLASGQGLATGTSQPRVSLPGGATALVGDPATDAVLTRDLTGAGGVVAARQELLGDLLRARLRGPGSAGGVVVLPPRLMSGQAGEALGQALKAAQSAGWAQLVGFDQVSSGAPQSAVGGFGGYPRSLIAGEIPEQALAVVAGVQPDLDTLTRVLSDPAHTTDVVHRATLRAVSTGWRADPGGALPYATGVEAYLDTSIGSVRLLPKVGTVTVTGNSATVPVTVANGLQQPIAGLVLRVTSANPGRLTIDHEDTGVSAPAVANHTEQVRVGAHDNNGPVQVTARLFTVNGGKPWGDPITFQVNVSKVSPEAVLTVLALVLLVLLAGVIKMRRARRKSGAE